MLDSETYMAIDELRTRCDQWVDNERAYRVAADDAIRAVIDELDELLTEHDVRIKSLEALMQALASRLQRRPRPTATSDPDADVKLDVPPPTA